MRLREFWVAVFMSAALLSLSVLLLSGPGEIKIQAQEPKPTVTLTPTAMPGDPPDLYVYKSKSSGSAAPGDDVQYGIEYGNSGYRLAAHDVRITDTLPALTTYVSDANSAGFTTIITGDTVVWTKPSVSTSESGMLYLTVHISDAAAVGDMLTNTVRISTVDKEDRGGYSNNTNIYALTLGADLYVSKGKYLGEVVPGEVITYGIYYHNLGGGVAHDARITDTLPAWVTYVSDSIVFGGHFTTVITGGTIVWTAPSIPGGENGGFFITVRISDAVSSGRPLVNRVQISTSNRESNYSNNVDADTQYWLGDLYLPLLLKEAVAVP